MGKKVASAPNEKKAALIAQTKELAAQVAQFKDAADKATATYTDLMWKFSNVVEDDALLVAKMITLLCKRLAHRVILALKVLNQRTTLIWAWALPALI